MSENSINDGGSAFPAECGLGFVHQPGMTLRDYFAAAALQGMFARANSHPAGHPKSPEGYSAAAFEAADAMLKAREKS